MYAYSVLCTLLFFQGGQRQRLVAITGDFACAITFPMRSVQSTCTVHMSFDFEIFFLAQTMLANVSTEH